MELKQEAENSDQFVKIEEYNSLMQEFTDFIYTVSHDLNSPMRHIREFNKLLVRSLGDRINEDEKKYVFYVEDGVRRAENILAGLLEYSRINTRAKPFTEINTNKIIEDVKIRLKSQISESSTKINVNPLPPLFGDYEQVLQVFLHIIDNAIKFTNHDINPEINIFGAQNDYKCIFSVKDNGIGIAKDQQENVFNLFKRLDNNLNKQGVGIGLTICKKIIKRHNGEIWIESEPDIGTTVYFSFCSRKKLTN